MKKTNGVVFLRLSPEHNQGLNRMVAEAIKRGEVVSRVSFVRGLLAKAMVKKEDAE